MSRQVHTFCRICEPQCPLVADIDADGKVAKLSPDPGHPCGGIACHKGLSYLDLHNDPDRLNWPLKRVNPRSEQRGKFIRCDWTDSMAEIGEKLKAIRAEHGPNAVAFYFGNPAAFNATALTMGGEFQDLIDTKMRFGANSQDASNKTVGACEIYGSPNSLMMPDLYHTDYLLCLGSNPKVSRWTVVSVPNDDMDVAKRIVDRGGKVRFVNPRRTESSTAETGPTLRIKPGTDVYFLAAVLLEIESLGGFDEDLLTRYGRNVDGLREFIRAYPADKVANVTGLSADSIREIAREIVAAKSAIVYMAVGVNQSRQGMLCYWLVEMINFATGNLGRRGGTYKPAGLVNHFPPIGGIQRIQTSVGEFELPDPMGYSVLPAAMLPDLIENGDIRALITLAGNPLLSVSGEDRMRKACEKLEMMVTIDIYPSVTGEISDYLLPGTDWIERMDINLLPVGMQPIPYVQYTDALEPPAYERRNAWWILSRLAQVMGVPSPLLDENPALKDGTDVLNAVLGARDLSIDKLKAMPRQTATFPQESRGTLYERCLQHPDHKIDCSPASFKKGGLFKRCHDIFEELQNEPEDTLKLIGLRTRYAHNSWLSNMEKFQRGKHSGNPLHMCELDAIARGLHNGDLVGVSTPFGTIETLVMIDDDLRPGVVAMTHGFGQQRAYRLSRASERAGANCNSLMPTGNGSYEPVSYMSWLSGIPVNVERVLTVPELG